MRSAFWPFVPQASPFWRICMNYPTPEPRRSLELPVTEQTVSLSPFASLTRFRNPHGSPQRTVLLVPPMSGAYPFVLWDVAAWFLDVFESDVWLVEWLNARRIPASAGTFDYDDQIDAIHQAIGLVGADAHIAAVCQAGPPTLIAAANAPASARPQTLSLFAAPIDPLGHPSVVSKDIRERGLPWFKTLTTRRIHSDGGARDVYPAEVHRRLLLNVLSQRTAHSAEMLSLAEDDVSGRSGGPSFVTRLSSFMDLPAEHFLSSLDRLFIRPDASSGGFRWRDAPIERRALSDVGLIAVEGAEDRIARPGQTAAALQMFPSQTGAVRRAILADGLGHLGVFCGVGWRETVAPKLGAALLREEERRAAAAQLQQSSPFARAEPWPDGQVDLRPIAHGA